MTAAATHGTAFPRHSNDPTPNTAKPTSMAGRRIRPARPPRPKAPRSRRIFVPTDLRSIERTTARDRPTFRQAAIAATSPSLEGFYHDDNLARSLPFALPAPHARAA